VRNTYVALSQQLAALE